MKIAVINNYDSFVHNIVHYLESINGVEVSIFLNNAFYMEELQNFDKIVLSPGPGIPKEAGLLLDVIDFYKDKKSILGVCLGHQAIAEYFGCTLKNLEKPLHGTATKLQIIQTDYLWNGLTNEVFVGHYHSWVVNTENFSKVISVTAVDDEGNIMALKHNFFDIRGVQFHPESVLTPQGKKIIENWVLNK
ncbi:aminodeoxychorismate/anthranilate synthase component II [Myroides sp. JBRI-B21084]|uniref:anthranilate synthase component II n=1 Tax=Myroides sp. JBRI-B21084 TaxID=3119977 RepID=UPI0026E25494|nr:aminodeoxychorismate/anthranilate synthase component II [Paenimyroides cloacae]WKW45690.1 aminodeoxychorismate/anthranilate synthase component II [Paenimyroides cloacae]